MKKTIRRSVLIGLSVSVVVATVLFITTCREEPKPEPEEYTATGIQTTGGTITVFPPAAVTEGTTMMLMLSGVEEDYEFIGWLFNPDVTLLGGGGIWTFTMPAANVTVRAIFDRKEARKYDVIKGTHTNGGFEIDPFLASAGTRVYLKNVIPKDGYEFLGWNITGGITPVLEEEGLWSFPMSPNDIIVNAGFDLIGAVTRYPVNKAVPIEGGNFSITPNPAAEDEWVTLVPAPQGDNQFITWTFDPVRIRAAETPPGSGQWRFQMPAEPVTVGAIFGVPGGDGVKTLTVTGGLGRISLNTNTGPGKPGTDNWDGTRHITVTVTLAGGAITNVVIGHPIAYPYRALNNPFADDANNLAAAVKNANDPDAPFTPAGGYSGGALDAWTVHEAAIRNAVKNAVGAIRDDKPNRSLAGGGLTGTTKTPWTADGQPLSGTATVTGAGYMRGGAPAGGGDQSSDSNLSTDFSITVVIAGGIITSVTAAGDETICLWDGGKVGQATTTWWPSAIISGNHYDVLQAKGGTPGAATPDTISGATYSGNAMREITKWAVEKIANEY